MKWFLVTWLLITLPCAATSVYQWTDAQGVLHLSDTRPVGEMSVTEYTVTSFTPSTPPVSPSSSLTPASPSTEPDIAVALSLLHPAEGATLRSNPGKLKVSASVRPVHAATESVVLLLDGAKVALSPQQTTQQDQRTLHWYIEPVDRGTHTVQVQYIENGKVIASSPVHRFFLHRAHLNQPSRQTH
jgi:hypothetical protein